MQPAQKPSSERAGMKVLRRLILPIVMLLLVTGGSSGTKAAPIASVGTPGTSTGPGIAFVNGQLVYDHDSLGNQVPDFSSAGYEGGKAPLPVAPVKQTLSPTTSGDDTARIQSAINAVSKLPLDTHGLRGAVFLTAGTYRIAGTLTINASGVILRGQGASGANRSVLVARGSPHTLVSLAGSGTWQAVSGSQHTIVDSYVPIGANHFSINSTTGLAVGDQVIVQRPQTQPWIHALGMDQIAPRSDGKPIHQWSPDQGLLFDRTITAIKGQQITIDAPLTNALEQEYGPATIWKYTFPGRISQAGVENLSSDGTAFTQDPTYPTSYFNAVFLTLNIAENSWIRNVSIDHYGQGFMVGTTAGETNKYITITRTSETNMSEVSASAGPAGYSLDGQQILLDHCTASGSNFHVWTTQPEGPGPNVVTQCTASGTKIDAAPHQRWSAGVLFDDLTISGTGSHFAIENRYNLGSGQGWSAGNSVLWNCTASTYTVQSPPTAYNWAFGCRGTSTASTFPGSQGVIFSAGTPVSPSSLYSEQLAERR